MISEADRRKAAELLLAAERDVKPVPQLADTFPGMEIADSYAIQRHFIDAKLKAGRNLRGHKIGLTSRAMQVASGINEPDYGHLLDDMFHDDGVTLPASRFIVPRIEVELAFVLGKPLKGPGVTLFDVAEDEHVVAVARLAGAAEANGGPEPDQGEPNEPERDGGAGSDEPERDDGAQPNEPESGAGPGNGHAPDDTDQG